MKTQSFKLLAVFLAAVLCATIIPFSVFAQEGETTEGGAGSGSSEGSDAGSGDTTAAVTLGKAKPTAGTKLNEYKLVGTTINETSDLTVLAVRIANGTFQLTATAPEGMTYIGGIDKDGNFVSTQDTTKAYTYATFQATASTAAQTVNDEGGSEGTPDSGENGTPAETKNQKLAKWIDENITFTEATATSETRTNATTSITLETGTIADMTVGTTKQPVKQFNGHYYAFFSVTGNSSNSWSNAYTAAKGMTFNGLKGYLATVTSAVENEALRTLVGGVINGTDRHGWIGGVRTTETENVDNSTPPVPATSGTNGKWIWSSGPEAGQVFLDGPISSSTKPDGVYSNWSAGEPNASGTGSVFDNALCFKSNGKWQDEKQNPTNNYVKGYYVEFGGYEDEKTTEDSLLKKTTGTPDLTAYKFVYDHASGNDWSAPYADQAAVTEDAKTKILAGKEQWNAMTQEQKNAVNELFGADKTFDTLLNEAEAQKFKDDNKANLEKTTIAAGDLDAIKKVLEDFNKLTEEIKTSATGQTIKTTTDNQKAFVDWLENHKEILTKTDVTPDDLEALLTANTQFTALDETNVQKFISDTEKARLAAATSASTWKTMHQEILNKTEVTAEDVAKIQEALTAYEALAEDAKKLAGELNKTKLESMKKAAELQQEFKEVLAKDTATLTEEDKKKLAEAKTKFDALEEAAQNFIPTDVKTKLNAITKADEWRKTHETIINKNADIADTDKTAVEKALADYEALADAEKALIDTAIISALKNKQAAANMLDAHKTVLSKEPLTSADKAEMEKAKAAFDALSDEQKALIGEATKTKLTLVAKATEWETAHADVLDKTEVAANDQAALEAAIKAYDELGDAQKLLDATVKTALDNKKAAADFQAKHPVVSKVPLAFTDIADLEQAKTAFEALTEEQKKLVPQAVKDRFTALEQAEAWNAAHKENAQKTPVTATDKAMLDDAGKAYSELTDKNLIDPSVAEGLVARQAAASWATEHQEIIEKVLAGNATLADQAALDAAVAAYDALGEGQAHVDPAIVSALRDAVVLNFIKEYAADKNGIAYTQATQENYEQILSGESVWNMLTAAQREAVNTKLQASAGQTYEQLLAGAKGFLSAASGAMEDNQTTADITAARTGDHSNALLVAICCVVAAFVATIVLFRRRTNASN